MSVLYPLGSYKFSTSSVLTLDFSQYSLALIDMVGRGQRVKNEELSERRMKNEELSEYTLGNVSCQRFKRKKQFMSRALYAI